MVARSTPPADPAAAEAIGEIRGQMRELIHQMNKMDQRNELTVGTLAELRSVPGRLTKIEATLELLDRARNQDIGARNVAMALLRSPAIGWLVGAAVTVWALLSGKGSA